MAEQCCPLCKGHCTNGAECAISQYLGKPIDWTQLPPSPDYRPELIPGRLPDVPRA